MEPTIQKTLDLFHKHMRDLENFKPGTDLEISLKMRWEGWREKEIKFELRVTFNDTNNNHNSILGESLTDVMTEVHRRLGFSDKQAVKLDAAHNAFKALPAPEEANF